ncbi:sigma-70 family RNA polymerase sigma factor [Nocardioides sp. NPDC051685]|uniref:sigma-70 family RNA polymerase sigma factor n=1 Tax=Nocardioides sp. NPDC051685 TaxID=3364334 RepID=UPI0037B5E9AD
MDKTQESSAVPVPLQREEDLVVRHLPVARSLAARYAGRGVEIDDLRQAARMGLVKAARRYDPARGEFLSYAVPVANGEMRHCFREMARGVRTQPLDDDTHGPLAEQLGAPDPGFEQAEARVMVEDAIDRLDEADRMIIRLRFVEGLSQAEIGERIGATQAQVSRALARIIRRMRVMVTA